MRILCWTPHFLPGIGGIEVLLARLLPALQARGHEFIVFTSDDGRGGPGDYAFGDVAVHRFAFGEALAWRDVARVAAIQRRGGALKREFRPDVVHLHHPGAIAFFHLATRRASPCPDVMTIHTPFPDATGDADTVFARSLRAASRVTSVSAATLDDVLARVPDVRQRASVIHNGVPEPAIAPSPLPMEPPHVLYVGRLAREKGADIALRAFATLRARMPRVRLTIAGDGPERGALEAEARARGIADAVTFTGWVAPGRVPALMNGATLVVVPSRYREPFGLVAVEAALLARPVVAARTGGLVEVIDDGATGVLVEPGNEDAFAAAMITLLASPATAAAMGVAARARAQARFGLDACADAYDRLYRQLG